MNLPLGRIVQGDSLAVLRDWPDACVQLVLTSPPYWGLREYKACGESLPGQWGREPTPEAHVERLVAWAREVRRVLRPDGVLVLNYGESYSSGGRATYRAGASGNKGHPVQNDLARPAMPAGLKPKNLLGIPWRLALALQADGWWWRAWWPWIKTNGMPESARDRPALSCEVMLMFTRSARYYWDQEAVRVGYSPASIARADGTSVTARGAGNVGFKRSLSPAAAKPDKQSGHGRRHAGFNDRWDAMPKEEQQAFGRIRKTGDWWRESLDETILQVEAWLAHARAVQAGSVPMLLDFDGLPIGQLHATFAYSGSHFATFSPALVRPIIRAATSERGQCPACGAPWVRQVKYGGGHRAALGKTIPSGTLATGKHSGWGPNSTWTETTGWSPSCACDAGEPVPSIICDPFAGTGTTCVVAAEEGRRTVGIDLYGGDYDFGGHTAMDRLRAAMGQGAPLEHVQAEHEGQLNLLEDEK